MNDRPGSAPRRPAGPPPALRRRAPRLSVLLAVGILLTAGSAGARDSRYGGEHRIEPSPERHASATDVLHRIEAEAREDDRDALREIARRLEGAPSARCGRCYARSLVAFRLAMALDLEEDREEMSAELATARTLLERRLDRSPGDPEATALLVAVLGRQIALRPVLGVFLGRRANTLLERSVARHPDHPRLTLQQGILAFFKPAFLGGGPETAEAFLRRALDLLAREKPEARPGWGRMDALIWLARSLDEQGRLAEARSVYERALRLAPNLRLLRTEIAELR